MLYFPAGTLALSAEKRLIKDLIDTYRQAGVIGRPVRNASDSILVSFGLALIQILNVDEKNQVLTISTWSRYVSITPNKLAQRGEGGGVILLSQISLNSQRPYVSLSLIWLLQSFSMKTCIEVENLAMGQ